MLSSFLQVRSVQWSEGQGRSGPLSPPAPNDVSLCPGHVHAALGSVVVALAVLGELLVLMVSEDFSNLSDCVIL